MFINSYTVAPGWRAWLPHVGRWLALMGAQARGRMLRGCCKGHQMPGGLGAGSCCIELSPLRKPSYFFIHSRTLKSCRVGGESSLVPRRQRSCRSCAHSAFFWGVQGVWGAVLGRGLCLWALESQGNNGASAMGLVLLGSALGSCSVNTHISLCCPPRDGRECQHWGHRAPAQEHPPASGESFGAAGHPPRGEGYCQAPAIASWL